MGPYRCLSLYNSAVRRFCNWSSAFSACELSKEVSDVLNNASNIAKEAGSGSVESEFVLKSLLSSGCLGGKTFKSINIGKDSLKRELESYIRKRKYANQEKRIGSSASAALLYAQSLALSSGKQLGSAELFEGLMKYDAFLQTVKNKKSHSDSAADADQADKYLINLTEKARSGLLGPFVVREAELERVRSTLGRMRKNNVLIVGAAGVGKTALVERLSVDLLREDESTNVLSLDLCGLYSGQGTRGELESKLNSLFERIKGGKTILFIDEIHHLLQNQEGGVNVTNLFKPIMTSGDVKIIGSTTLREYHKYFRHDRAFERRFDVIRLSENTKTEAVLILNSIRPSLESYHNVAIANDAITASVELTKRFIPNRVLPDKAIDVLDEAAMLVKRTTDPAQHAETELTNRKNLLLARLISDGDRANSDLKFEIEGIDVQLSKLRESDMTMRDLNRKLQDLHELKRSYEKSGELLKASELCNHAIPELLRSIENVKSDTTGMMRAMGATGMTDETCVGDKQHVLGRGPTPQVDKHAVAMVVSRKTGVPLDLLIQSNTKHYKEILDKLKYKVIGQDVAVEKTLLQFYKHNCGMTAKNRVAGALCFAGPAGVGKRTLLNSISRMLGLTMKTLACSQLHGANATSVLVGSPPGYVGHREGGILSEWIKDSPYSIILFEEADLLHDNAANIIANAMDKGYLMDNQGDECGLEQSFFVFQYKTQQTVHDVIRKQLDEMVIFKELGHDTVREITKLKLSEIGLVNLRCTEAAVEHVCRLGEYNNSAFKLVEQVVESAICRLVINGDLPRHSNCKLTLGSEVDATAEALPITNELSIVKCNV
ncbi:ATP-dependent CLP protease [Babesia gibsoni]|uniref:ATP-dependent CLP protease n=1 Tax=Babesia gibsoni TaxID=33632 RepID=A0AAD8PE05_BABGI|nr:ATP-dependent CLP protease [Babesia gibsoni]